MVGALHALQEVRGVNPNRADVIVGTSAGAVLGALIAAGVTTQQLVDHQRGHSIAQGPLAGYAWDYETATGGSRPSMPRLRGPGSMALLGSGLRRALRMPPTAYLSAFVPLGTGSLDRVGHLVDAITPMGHWSPHPDLRVIAMDYAQGRRVVFGTPLAPSAELSQAVMASCAIPGWFEPVTVDGVPYVDGGAWSATSVDVLADADVDDLHVIAPMVSFASGEPNGLISRVERFWRGRVTARCLQEIDAVEATGAQVHVLGPGEGDLEAMGVNVMETSRRLSVLETSLETSRAGWGNGGNASLAHTG
jgi:NTE family protein